MASSRTPQDVTPPPIRACLFDMDGLLINSEDLYTVCTNAVLREYGKPDLPWDIKAQMQGRPAPTAGKILFDWAQLPIGREEYLAKVQEQQSRLFPTTEPLPGVVSLLQTLSKKSDPPVYMALATSSHSKNYHLKSSHLDMFDCFRPENTVLGDDPRIGKGRGKPAPDIYLLALETVNKVIRKEGGKPITPAECLVFEDSVPGVESGRRAGMQVIWCPHPGLLNEYKGREERVLAGLMGEHKEVEERNEQIGVVTEGCQKRSSGAPGELGDGWGRLLHTLEDFPYELYGIKV